MVAAFMVVTLLEQTSGPIKFSAPGFTFEGAAGQVLFWVIVFLAITHSVETLWPLTFYDPPIAAQPASPDINAPVTTQ